MVIGHISPYQQKGGLSVAQHTGLYQAQTLELRGRKRREADHAHFIVTTLLRQSRGRQLQTSSLPEGALPPLLLKPMKKIKQKSPQSSRSCDYGEDLTAHLHS